MAGAGNHNPHVVYYQGHSATCIFRDSFTRVTLRPSFWPWHSSPAAAGRSRRRWTRRPAQCPHRRAGNRHAARHAAPVRVTLENAGDKRLAGHAAIGLIDRRRSAPADAVKFTLTLGRTASSSSKSRPAAAPSAATIRFTPWPGSTGRQALGGPSDSDPPNQAAEAGGRRAAGSAMAGDRRAADRALLASGRCRAADHRAGVRRNALMMPVGWQGSEPRAAAACASPQGTWRARCRDDGHHAPAVVGEARGHDRRRVPARASARNAAAAAAVRQCRCSRGPRRRRDVPRARGGAWTPRRHTGRSRSSAQHVAAKTWQPAEVRS